MKSLIRDQTSGLIGSHRARVGGVGGGVWCGWGCSAGIATGSERSEEEQWWSQALKKADTTAYKSYGNVFRFSIL